MFFHSDYGLLQSQVKFWNRPLAVQSQWWLTWSNIRTSSQHWHTIRLAHIGPPSDWAMWAHHLSELQHCLDCMNFHNDIVSNLSPALIFYLMLFHRTFPKPSNCFTLAGFIFSVEHWMLLLLKVILRLNCDHSGAILSKMCVRYYMYCERAVSASNKKKLCR